MHHNQNVCWNEEWLVTGVEKLIAMLDSSPLEVRRMIWDICRLSPRFELREYVFQYWYRDVWVHLWRNTLPNSLPTISVLFQVTKLIRENFFPLQPQIHQAVLSCLDGNLLNSLSPVFLPFTKTLDFSHLLPVLSEPQGVGSFPHLDLNLTHTLNSGYLGNNGQPNNQALDFKSQKMKISFLLSQGKDEASQQ
eukprot:TRINITY_DN3467_c0_g1_i1.p1 TRINITY_DN3467_c0_g1~~TRINITY_DN3467_c0_g1_i1.p1  ORF type:complete len:193 (+),score=12.66 TRINITY_DN3467_c0_g1_i1:140-718(+)